MKNKKNNSGILAKIIILFAVIMAIFAGGYFFLDKLIIPKYFDKYGISGVGDLVDVVASLYNSPKESKMIKNGYTQIDLTNAISKLQTAGYKIENDGTIYEENGDYKQYVKDISAKVKEFVSSSDKIGKIDEFNLNELLKTLNKVLNKLK